jgi:hypothetical protein
MAGCVALARTRARALGWVALALISSAVVYSNALAYHEASLAPRDRLKELDRIGESLGGNGPTVYLEFEEYAKHFLRDGDPAGWSEAYGPRGGVFSFPTRTGAIPNDQLQRYTTIVQRKSPIDDRPPSNYELVFSGRYYEVWRRDRSAPEVIGRQEVLVEPTPSATVPCGRIATLARDARRQRARLAALPRPMPVVVELAQPEPPDAWRADRNDPGLIRPNGPSRFARQFAVNQSGRYELWLGGSFARTLHVSIDGRPVGSVFQRLNERRQHELIATVTLHDGTHELEIRRDAGDLRPGDDAPEGVRTAVFTPPGRPSVVFVEPGKYRRLCNRPLDWIEIVR